MTQTVKGDSFMEKQQEKTVAPTPEAMAALVALYIYDVQFRAEFDKDPKAALAAFGGEPLPPGVEVVVHRNESDRWHLSLPSEEVIEALSREMGDEDLEKISGGGFPYNGTNAEKSAYYAERRAAYAAGNWPPRRTFSFFTGWGRDPLSGRPIPPG